MKTVPPEFSREFERARGDLLAAFRAVAADLKELLTTVAQRDPPASAALDEQTAAQWLEEPVRACRRIRPIERVLEAIEQYRRRSTELIRAASVAGELFAEQLPDWFDAIERREGRAWGRLVAAAAQACVELLAPWEGIRRATLLAAVRAGGQGRRAADRPNWQARLRRSSLRLQEALTNIGRPPRLPSLRRPRSASRRRKLRALLDQRLAWWKRYGEAVAELLAFELALWETSLRIERAAEAAIAQLEYERGELLGEIDALMAWLDSPDGEPPLRRGSLLRAELRIERWRQEAAAAVRETAPAQLQVVVRWVALPSRRSPWRLVHPQRELINALEKVAGPQLLSAFREIESLHRTVLRDLERARQVIAFGRELADREGESGKAAAREALQNALLLLRHSRESLPEVRSLLEPATRRALAATLYRVHLELERDRLGLWGFLAREGARQGASAAREWLLRVLGQGVRAWRSAWLRGSQWLLGRIGWEQATAPAPVHVERREILSESLGVDLAPRGLSLIYRRLFQPEPLQDPRFLVGREAEMAAMRELRRLWEQNRAACALVVGERGSGKTSLLNCACAEVFHDVEVTRTQFQERLWTASDMRRFLEDRLALNAECRAVVILEELERAFLRCVGGFDAFRELLRAIVATSGNLLWIAAMNRAAFQLLQAALGLDRYFSHRINATAVERRHLEEAILVRHHLSGLRLHFLPPAETAWRRRWSVRLGLGISPQQAFFDALYRESEGLFRSAFELWLRHIDRSEAGVLYVKPLEAVSYDSLLTQLNLDDLFTLQALLQHGSLTPEEHALVFNLSPRASQDRLQLLEDRELLQPDPGRAGFRVRPEAARAVRVALHRSNLL